MLANLNVLNSIHYNMHTSARAKMLAATQNDVGVYVHFPYCLQKCPYCDFNSHVPRRLGMYGDFVDAVCIELEHRLPEAGQRRLASVYFGGGTPSLMSAESTARILQTIFGYFGGRRRDSIEVTLEANPGAVERGRMQDFKQAGINRVSMGVQALDNRLLRQLGRIHDEQQARDALEAIAETKFDSHSIDLIFAVPGQTRDDWRSALGAAINLATPHISAYNLTYESGTLMTAWRDNGRLKPITDELESEMFDDTVEQLESAGLRRYEVSNFSLPGHESVHNRLYWQGLPYVGVGPGAHSFTLTTNHAGAPLGVRKEGRRQPEVYAKSWRSGVPDFEFEETVDATAMAHERALVGLRTVQGFVAEEVENTLLTGAVAAAKEVALRHPEWCFFENGTLRPTALGLRVANSLVLQVSKALDQHGKVRHGA